MFSLGASCPVSHHRRLSASNVGIRSFRFDSVVTVKRDYALKAKDEYFGVDLKTDITVESEVVEPCSKIKGHLVIDTKFSIEHDGIIILLEAICNLNYSTKQNETTIVHQGEACILENTKLNEFGHLESPIKCEIIPITTPEVGGHTINSGSWHYPFQLQIPSDPHLPARFQNSYGTLNYRLVVYMISHSSSTYVQLAEKSMRCDGHYNLYDMDEASKPIVIEQYYRKSYFSQKKLIKATLSVQSTGFLQHEDVPFSLFIKNPKCIPLQLSVNLLQHVKYQANTNLASVVKIVTTVESQERNECDKPLKSEIHWVGKLRVPESQAPTFACNSVSMYNVSYVLEFQVKSLKESVVTGQANLIVGTTRDPIIQVDHLPVIQMELCRSGSVPANLRLSVDEPDEIDSQIGQFLSTPRHEATRCEPQPEKVELPSFSPISCRMPSTGTLPSTYASLDLNAEPPPSLLMLGNIVDIDGRFPIDMNSLSLGDEYQITFYSV